MKNVKIQFPYITITITATYEDIVNHPDPRVAENVRRSMGEMQFRLWKEMHEHGIIKPIRIQHTLHIIDAVKDPMILGQLLGMSVVLLPVAFFTGACIKFAAIGVMEVVDFLKELL